MTENRKQKKQNYSNNMIMSLFEIEQGDIFFYKTNKKINLKAISSTYELLIPAVKGYLEKTFKCKVFDNYGCSEFGSIAFSCEKGKKHIFENSVFVEIINIIIRIK